MFTSSPSRTMTAILFAGCVSMSGGSHAQSCEPGPRCAAADAKANTIIPTLPVQGSHGAASQAYCINMIVAEVARACAAEFRQKGNAACAEQAEAQSAASRSVAEHAGGVAAATSATGWRSNCLWE